MVLPISFYYREIDLPKKKTWKIRPIEKKKVCKVKQLNASIFWVFGIVENTNRFFFMITSTKLLQISNWRTAYNMYIFAAYRVEQFQNNKNALLIHFQPCHKHNIFRYWNWPTKKYNIVSLQAAKPVIILRQRNSIYHNINQIAV